MKHVAEIRTGRNVQQVVLRGLQFATSQPEVSRPHCAMSVGLYADCFPFFQGPVYCWTPRETSEEDLDPATIPHMRMADWQGSRLGALPNDGKSYWTHSSDGKF